MNGSRVDILYIVNGNGLSSNQGGSIVRTFEVAKRVQGAGLRVGLLATSGGIRAASDRGFAADLTVETPVFPLGPRRETGPLNRAVNYLWTSASASLTGSGIQARVTVTDSDYPCDVLPAAAHSRLRGSRWVACVHHRLERASGSALRNASVVWQGLAWRLMARRASRILVYDSPMGASIGRELLRLGAAEESLRRMTNGVDFREILETPPAKDRWHGLFVGGLRPDKGLEDLPGIWAEVVGSLPSAKLAVAGGAAPRHARAFDEACRRAGIGDRVVRLGNLPPATVYGLMKKARCVLAATRAEGWGTATCEALAAGTPVVAFDLPTTRHVFGDQVDLVPCFDHRAFAERVLKHLRGRPSGKNAKRRSEFARSFDWDEVARRDIEVLEGVL